MHRTRVKICGVTCPEDAVLAAEAGADAVGMVFHPGSKRGVSIDQARLIVAALPPMVTPIGLFVDRDPMEVAAVARATSIRTVQLHGMESPNDVARLAEFTVFKALKVSADTFVTVLSIWRHAIGVHKLTNLASLLLDTATVQGGSGIENDWTTIRKARDSGDLSGLPRLILAGGLRADNVGGVIRSLRPWGVDVSSGVEGSEARRKDPGKLESYIAAIREADAAE